MERVGVCYQCIVCDLISSLLLATTDLLCSGNISFSKKIKEYGHRIITL